MEDFEEDYDLECTHCGHSPIRSRDCDRCGGEGFRDDLYEEDPLWYDPDEIMTCSECSGKGTMHWCPKCGEDYEFEEEEVSDAD